MTSRHGVAAAFIPPKLKVDRAKQHISELRDQIAAFSKRKPAYLSIEPSADGKKTHFVIRISEGLPAALSAVAGDAIHNLRASLDLLAYWALREVGVAEGHLAKVYFPMCQAGECKKQRGVDGRGCSCLECTIENRRISKAPPEIVDLFRRLRPYYGGNNFIRLIHDLDIADKHRNFITLEGSAKNPIDLFVLNGKRLVQTDSGISMTGIGAINFVNNVAIVTLPRSVQHPMGAKLPLGIRVSIDSSVSAKWTDAPKSLEIVDTLLKVTEAVESGIEMVDHGVRTYLGR